MSEVGQKLIQSVREYAAANPNYKYIKPIVDTGLGEYEECLYVHNGTPSCLIGFGLWEQELIDEGIEDTYANTRSINTPSMRTYIPALAELEDIESTWLRAVQSWQDGGYAWSNAVYLADDQYSRVAV